MSPRKRKCRCKKWFIPDEKHRRVCQECKKRNLHASGSVKLQCKNCGKTFSRYICHTVKRGEPIKRFFCSKECLTKWRKEHGKEFHGGG